MIQKNKKTSKKPVSTETTFFFLSSILQKSENFVRHMDNQTSILVGLSAGLFILSISQIEPENINFSFSFIPLLTLALFSLSSALVAIFALIPPRFMRKKGQKESLLYNKEIVSLSSADQYAKELRKISGDFDNIIDQYALEIYNICRYYYRPKRRLFKISRQLLCIGIFISLAVISIQFLLSIF